MKAAATNSLYYGDNLEVLRNDISEEFADLIYLDPPFNSNANYNVLFKSPKGEQSAAQIEAFEDTWHWGSEAEKEFSEILHQSNTKAAEVVTSMRQFLGENDMMAYLVMMANRLIELHSVLKPNGSLYLHCDPTASHYLKIVLDAVFSPECFKSEIIWRRTGSHNKATRWAPIHDTIFFYTKDANKYTWNSPKRPYMRKHVTDNFLPDGEGGWKTNYYGNVLTGSGTRNGKSGEPWKGINPTVKGRHWAIPGALWEDSGIDPTGLDQLQKLDALFEAGYIKVDPGAAWPMYERKIRPTDGPSTSDIWAFQPYTDGTVFGTEEGIDTDVSWLKPQDQERLGYPTQKPIALLERIILASSKPGDVVLDPFCGCGTAVHAAEKLGRQWVGIDITHLSITLIEKRLRDAFPETSFDVHGTPKDNDSARDLAHRDKYQFQWWACSLVNAQPYGGKKKGADGGIDGIIYFQDDKGAPKKIVVSVKGGDNVNVAMLRDLAHVVDREKASIGLFITLADATKPMQVEATKAGFYESKPTGKNFPKIQILTVEGLLDGSQRALFPDLGGGGLTFKKVKKEEKKQEQKALF